MWAEKLAKQETSKKIVNKRCSEKYFCANFPLTKSLNMFV
jgi:hypothetical protein